MNGEKNPNPTNLERIRRERGLSRPQLAAKAGVGVKIIEKCEQRERDIGGMAVRSALALADVLGVDVRDILN